MTHSLHSFKSPDIILSATRRPKTQKKAPAPKIMQTKLKGFARTVFAPRDQTEPCPHKHQRNLINGTAWLVWGGKDSKQTLNTTKEGMHSMRKGFPSRKEPRNHLTPRPVGPKNAPGAKRDGAQTDKTQGYGKVMCKNLNWAISLFHPYSPQLFFFPFSFSLSVLNECCP